MHKALAYMDQMGNDLVQGILSRYQLSMKHDGSSALLTSSDEIQVGANTTYLML